MIFFKVFQYLYPRSKAFRSVIDGPFKKFLKGLSYVPEDLKHYLEGVYGDLFPDTTREISKWEEQFGLVFTTQYDDVTRRKLLKSFWNINTGGQASAYLERILQQVSTDFKVIENLPVRDPRDSNVAYAAVNFNKNMCCGNKYAVCGRKVGDSTFVPTVLKNDSESFYALPADAEYWRNCFFICKSAVRNRYGAIIYIQKLVVEKKWRDFIEYIILKVKPAHTTAILFVEYI